MSDVLIMTNEEAEQLLQNRLEAIKQSLVIKAKEYVRNNDRMHNFNVAAQKTGKTREECLAGFRLKHEVSVDDIRNDINKGILPSQEIVKEKFGDIINYYILEEMSILHKIQNGKEI
jgi:DNA-binding phage protein